MTEVVSAVIHSVLRSWLYHPAALSGLTSSPSSGRPLQSQSTAGNLPVDVLYLIFKQAEQGQTDLFQLHKTRAVHRLVCRQWDRARTGRTELAVQSLAQLDSLVQTLAADKRRARNARKLELVCFEAPVDSLPWLVRLFELCTGLVEVKLRLGRDGRAGKLSWLGNSLLLRALSRCKELEKLVIWSDRCVRVQDLELALANWPNLVHLDIPNFYYTPRPNQPHLSPLIVPALRTLHFQLDHLSALPLFAALVAASAATLTDLELVWESEHVPRAEFVTALTPCLPTLERLLLVNANPRLEDLGYLAVIWWQCTKLTTATVSRGELEGPLMDQAIAATGKEPPAAPALTDLSISSLDRPWTTRYVAECSVGGIGGLPEALSYDRGENGGWVLSGEGAGSQRQRPQPGMTSVTVEVTVQI